MIKKLGISNCPDYGLQCCHFSVSRSYPAGLHALKRANQAGSPGGAAIHTEDLAFGLGAVQPSAMREVAIEIPQVMYAWLRIFYSVVVMDFRPRLPSCLPSYVTSNQIFLIKNKKMFRRKTRNHPSK